MGRWNNHIRYKLKQLCECPDSMGCTIKSLQEIIVNKYEIVNFHYFVPPIALWDLNNISPKLNYFEVFAS